MKLSRFFELAVAFGIECDPRKKRTPVSYPDSAILYGDPARRVKSILVGIDIEAPELLLADRLRRDRPVDLVVSHHPEGAAFASLHEVMRLQVDLLRKAGIKEPVARQLLEERIYEVARRILPQNHMRSVDVARLLDLPFACIHTPADNHVSEFTRRLMDKEKPKRLQDIVDILMGLPEYKQAAGNSAGPAIIRGSPRKAVGKVFVEMTGGTEGSKDAYDKLYKKGVRTIVCMHLSEEHFKKVKDVNLNVVIAGHISSDTLGLNLLLDKIEREEALEVIDCSGFRRFRRI